MLWPSRYMRGGLAQALLCTGLSSPMFKSSMKSCRCCEPTAASVPDDTDYCAPPIPCVAHRKLLHPVPVVSLHAADALRFDGVRRLYGPETPTRLQRARVVVVGLGGVGSWAVEALARSGIGSLVLIDLDEICISVRHPNDPPSPMSTTSPTTCRADVNTSYESRRRRIQIGSRML